MFLELIVDINDKKIMTKTKKAVVEVIELNEVIELGRNRRTKSENFLKDVAENKCEKTLNLPSLFTFSWSRSRFFPCVRTSTRARVRARYRWRIGASA